MSKIIIITPVPDEAQLLDIMKLAAASHLHLISNGKVSRLCSIVPAGWHKITAMVKPLPEAA